MIGVRAPASAKAPRLTEGARQRAEPSRAIPSISVGLSSEEAGTPGSGDCLATLARAARGRRREAHWKRGEGLPETSD